MYWEYVLSTTHVGLDQNQVVSNELLYLPRRIYIQEFLLLSTGLGQTLKLNLSVQKIEKKQQVKKKPPCFKGDNVTTKSELCSHNE